jgi:hypothetical protein
LHGKNKKEHKLNSCGINQIMVEEEANMNMMIFAKIKKGRFI